ncbi:MAG: HNH endonuclease [Armatimonadota bacterium]|nr:HNH endonuclease [Armatimonadota bacterium]MDW8105129.1 HNH endonuclease [Armatimonadota bacterium]MDW8290995.1 HNH endonuclease [Armatimonadota bacterium]
MWETDRQVLVLNNDYEPLNVCNVRRALVLVLLGKAEVLHADGIRLHTVDRVIQVPSVVKLRYHVKRPLPELKLTRRTIFARDDYTCQYCGYRGKDLTVDHVVPRRLGGSDDWENLVTCCRKCNLKKGDKPLHQTGMTLLRQPRRPRYVPYISLSKYIEGTKNEVWRLYLPFFSDVAPSGD